MEAAVPASLGSNFKSPPHLICLLTVQFIVFIFMLTNPHKIILTSAHLKIRKLRLPEINYLSQSLVSGGTEIEPM